MKNKSNMYEIEVELVERSVIVKYEYLFDTSSFQIQINSIVDINNNEDLNKDYFLFQNRDLDLIQENIAERDYELILMALNNNRSK